MVLWRIYYADVWPTLSERASEYSVNKSDVVPRTNCILCALCGQNIARNNNYYKPKRTVNISINSLHAVAATSFGLCIK